MLLAFVDASWDKNRQVVSVAGFLGVSSAWCAFQEHWQGVRNRWGLKFLRMTEFMSSHGEPYATWSAAQRNALVSELTDLINKHLLCGTVVSLNLTDYYALSDEDRAVSGNNPFGLCAAQCLGLVASTFEQFDIEESVLYVFEAGDRGEPAFRDAVRRLIRSSEPDRALLHVIDIRTETKSLAPAFDAADFLAWLHTQHALRFHGQAVDRTPYLEQVTVDIINHHMYGAGLLEWVHDNKPDRDEVAKRLGRLGSVTWRPWRR